jgi:hypothetical protein
MLPTRGIPYSAANSAIAEGIPTQSITVENKKRRG